MKTRITVDTTKDQELVIGMAETGELASATQQMVRDHFEAIVRTEQVALNAEVTALKGVVSHKSNEVAS